MNVSVVNGSLASVGADAVVVGVYAEEKKLRDPAGRVDQAAGGAVRHVLDAEKFQGKVGQVTHIHTNGNLPSRRVVVVGLGRRRDTTAESVRRAASAGVRRARDLGAKNVAIEVLGDRLPARQRAQSVVEGAILGTYTFDQYKREKTDKHVETLRLSEPDGRYRREATEGARRGQIFAEATWFARDLVNAPANDVHPTHLAEVRRRDRQGRRSQAPGAGARRLREARHGRVSRRGPGQRAAAQVHPPHVRARRPAAAQEGRGHRQGHHVRLRRPRPQDRRRHAAHEGRHVGGGRRARHLRRRCPQLKPPVEVHGLIAATENMPSGTASGPGDIVRAMNGLTIEIGNTDAEGRLTLADALCLRRPEDQADEMVDMATLTGACVVALGPLVSGLFASNDGLA